MGYSDIAMQDWQPVALYINGEYWGIYAIREKINEQYFAAREGLDPDHMDIVKGDTNTLSGDKTGWRDLREYARNHDMRQQVHYDYIAARLDIDNFIDYLIAEIFFANSDTGNKKSYREAPEGANGGSKWKMVLFDFDMTVRAGAMGPPRNTIAEMFNPNGHGVNNMFFTALQVGLLQNSGFKAKFKARYLELLDTAFSPAHMEEVLDRMAAQVEPEIAANAARWGKPTPDYWRAQVEEVRAILQSRPAVAKQQMEAFLG
jgi:spore coat protein CotH